MPSENEVRAIAEERGVLPIWYGYAVASFLERGKTKRVTVGMLVMKGMDEKTIEKSTMVKKRVLRELEKMSINLKKKKGFKLHQLHLEINIVKHLGYGRKSD